MRCAFRSALGVLNVHARTASSSAACKTRRGSYTPRPSNKVAGGGLVAVDVIAQRLIEETCRTVSPYREYEFHMPQLTGLDNECGRAPMRWSSPPQASACMPSENGPCVYSSPCVVAFIMTGCCRPRQAPGRTHVLPVHFASYAFPRLHTSTPRTPASADALRIHMISAMWTSSG